MMEGTEPIVADETPEALTETEVRPLTQADVLASADVLNAQPVADRDQTTVTERTLSDGHENKSTRIDH